MPGCTFYQNIEVDITTEEFKDFMCQNSSFKIIVDIGSEFLWVFVITQILFFELKL